MNYATEALTTKTATTDKAFCVCAGAMNNTRSLLNTAEVLGLPDNELTDAAPDLLEALDRVLRVEGVRDRVAPAEIRGQSMGARTMTADHAAALAMFLLERTGTVLGVWSGRLPATLQRALFGRFMGKGLLCINGNEETLSHTRKVCFGHDYDRQTFAWRTLN